MAKTIAPQELQERLGQKNKKVICVDVRTEGEHDAARIPNTINIPVDQLRTHINELKKYDEIYLHCTSGSRSQIACGILSDYGFDNQYSLEGGFGAWRAKKLPVVGNNKTRIPIMRQVLIAAAMIVLAGLIFKVIFQNDLFLLLPFGVSIGFLYAGFSGNCLMTKILIKAPWNQHKD
ncbi:MAG: rhodanese-like domain-containing protein [Patescibacteria group bacterium]|nr:rhodanese-like domain-containing protein [Patescibacteria group bacterium]